MTTFKYTLDKSSKKFICPSCGKQRFVKYVDTISNGYLNVTFGRCDRETSCGYHQSPTENEVLVAPNNLLPTIITTPDYIDYELLEKSRKNFISNNFIKYLRKYFNETEITNAIDNYKIGTSKHWNGATIFWQINQSNLVHTGKIILFDENTGKRVKNPFPHIYWVHKKITVENFHLQQCLFGLHLVANPLQQSIVNPLQRTVAIVESEKTAIVMSLFLPNYIWLATGSKQNLKFQLLQPLKKQAIVLFPDKGEFEDWNKKTMELQKKGFDIKCSSILEKDIYELGSDLADLYFASKDKHNSQKPIRKIDTFYSNQVEHLSAINPSLLKLITTFDLIDEKGSDLI